MSEVAGVATPPDIDKTETLIEKPVVGRYRVAEMVGRGSMAVVWRAHDPFLDRTVAVKMLSDDYLTDDPERTREFHERFLREARAAASLVHPNIVTIHDAGLSDAQVPFLVMELVAGKSLQAILRSDGPMPPVDAAIAGESLALALACAHNAGIIHRDVKPANALRDETGKVKLMDFGLAHLASSGLTRKNQYLGSPLYSAPEHIVDGAVTPASDQFGLAVSIYTLVTGIDPFRRKGLRDSVRALVEEDPPLPSDVRAGLSPVWDDALARAMEKDPADRYPSAEAFAGAFVELREVMEPVSVDDPDAELELVVVEGPDQGCRIPVGAGVDIGRRLGDLMLRDKTVSQRHCRVEPSGDGIVVIDHESRNGTRVRKQKITRARLEAGDMFSVGNCTRLRVVRCGLPADQTTVVDNDALGSASTARSLSVPRFGLRIEAGPLKGQRFTIAKTLVIGRDEGDIQLRDARVSRKHAAIQLVGASRLVLRDLASSNGTWVDGQQIREVELRGGDQFLVGSTVILVDPEPIWPPQQDNKQDDTETDL